MNKKQQQQTADGKSYYGFDSTGLEKAAAAAKYLDGSKNAKQAFDLANKKEESKQLEHKENIEKLAIEKTKIAEEERRKTVQYETDLAKRRAEYQVQLDLQKEEEMLRRKEGLREERRRNDEESVKRQEQLKMQTLEYEYNLKQQLKKAEMEIEKEERMNMIKNQEKERRETVRQALVTGFNLTGQGIATFFSSPKYIFKTAYLSAMMFGAYQFTKVAATMVGAGFMTRFGRPNLVRQTSKIYTTNLFAVPWLLMKRTFHRNLRRKEANLLDGVILNEPLEKQLREISYAVLNRKKHFAPAKNLLFWGPPGTGKTLFAKKLAMQSGLDYAVMTGSDVAPLGKHAVSELNNLFDWAEKSPNGMILFVDEADAFLRSRTGGEELSELLRQTINTFLARTGSPSYKVITVLASNIPEQLDDAVHDRVDEIVYFGRPSEEERKNMLFHYLVEFCQPPQNTAEQLKFFWKHPRSIYTGRKLIRMEGVSNEYISDLAKKIDGFSGREIFKMVVAWHDAAFSKPDPVLTPELMDEILVRFKEQHAQKAKWTKSEGKLLEKMA
jgi:ATPase family AAA domain-containing protein 3A/B